MIAVFSNVISFSCTSLATCEMNGGKRMANSGSWARVEPLRATTKLCNSLAVSSMVVLSVWPTIAADMRLASPMKASSLSTNAAKGSRSILETDSHSLKLANISWTFRLLRPVWKSEKAVVSSRAPASNASTAADTGANALTTAETWCVMAWIVGDKSCSPLLVGSASSRRRTTEAHCCSWLISASGLNISVAAKTPDIAIMCFPSASDSWRHIATDRK